jgi:hypothetical protein
LFSTEKAQPMRFRVLLVFVLMLSVAPMASASVAIGWDLMASRAATANHRQSIVPLALVGSSSSLTKLAIYVIEQLCTIPAAASDTYEALHSGSSPGDSAVLATSLHQSVGSTTWASHQQAVHAFSPAFGIAGSQTGPGLGSSPVGFTFNPTKPTHISLDTSAIAAFHDSIHNLGGAAGSSRDSEQDDALRALVVPEAGSFAIWSLIGGTLLGLLGLGRGRLG